MNITVNVKFIPPPPTGAWWMVLERWLSSNTPPCSRTLTVSYRYTGSQTVQNNSKSELKLGFGTAGRKLTSAYQLPAWCGLCVFWRARAVVWIRVRSRVRFSRAGNSTEPWAINLESKNFHLLCPQGARAEVTQYARCNLASVPSHAVMVRPDTSAHVVFGLLDKAQVRRWPRLRGGHLRFPAPQLCGYTRGLFYKAGLLS